MRASAIASMASAATCRGCLMLPAHVGWGPGGQVSQVTPIPAVEFGGGLFPFRPVSEFDSTPAGRRRFRVCRGSTAPADRTVLYARCILCNPGWLLQGSAAIPSQTPCPPPQHQIPPPLPHPTGDTGVFPKWVHFHFGMQRKGRIASLRQGFS